MLTAWKPDLTGWHDLPHAPSARLFTSVWQF